jgi:hypothetical protein
VVILLRITLSSHSPLRGIFDFQPETKETEKKDVSGYDDSFKEFKPAG